MKPLIRSKLASLKNVFSDSPLAASSDIVTFFTICLAIHLSIHLFEVRNRWGFHIKFLCHTTINFLGCLHYFFSIHRCVSLYLCSILLLNNCSVLSSTWFAQIFPCSSLVQCNYYFSAPPYFFLICELIKSDFSFPYSTFSTFILDFIISITLPPFLSFLFFLHIL